MGKEKRELNHCYYVIAMNWAHQDYSQDPKVPFLVDNIKIRYLDDEILYTLT